MADKADIAALFQIRWYHPEVFKAPQRRKSFRTSQLSYLGGAGRSSIGASKTTKASIASYAELSPFEES